MGASNTGKCTILTGIIKVTLILVLHSVQVQSTIEFAHKLTKTKVFESTSDITVKRVKWEVGGGHSQSRLVLSEPADGCQFPKNPPSISSNFYTSNSAASKSPSSVPITRWILLVSDGGCELRTKAENAAALSYSGVIVKQADPDNVSGYQDLQSDEGVLIDVILLGHNEWDNVTRFVHPKPYIISLGADHETDANQERIYTWVAGWIKDTIYPIGCCCCLIILYCCWTSHPFSTAQQTVTIPAHRNTSKKCHTNKRIRRRRQRPSLHTGTFTPSTSNTNNTHANNHRPSLQAGAFSRSKSKTNNTYTNCPSLPAGTFIGIRDQYKIAKLISRGGFGEVYRGLDRIDTKRVAIKVALATPEGSDSKVAWQGYFSQLQLENEIKVYKELEREHNGKLFPRAYNFFQLDNSSPSCPSPTLKRNVLVLDFMGQSLDVLFGKCDYKFSLKTILMFVDQALDQLQFLHRHGFLHRDVKPANFVLGPKRSEFEDNLYLIDFGLVTNYSTNQGSQIEGLPIMGSFPFCSMNAHRGLSQGRKDDLESLGYVLYYFFRQGKLAVQIPPNTTPETENQMWMDWKMRMEQKDWAFNRHSNEFWKQPHQFRKYMRTVRALEFYAEPDYQELQEIFREFATMSGVEYDGHWDWNWDY